MLVAAAGRGICALFLGDSVEELERELRDEFNAAELRRDDHALRADAKNLREYLRGRSAAPDLSVELIGGEFQRRVWDALRNIPFGQTRSYQQVAEMIGQPAAVRAVANACASNRIALLIPCHRVVRADGSLAGYRWKAERKERLLDLERKAERIESQKRLDQRTPARLDQRNAGAPADPCARKKFAARLDSV